MSNRNTRRGKPWSHAEPDIRETKRRLSGWSKEDNDPMHRINAINGKAKSSLRAKHS